MAMKKVVLSLRTTNTKNESVAASKKDHKKKNNTTANIKHASIPKSDVERFTKSTIKRNRRLFERLAKA